MEPTLRCLEVGTLAAGSSINSCFRSFLEIDDVRAWVGDEKLIKRQLRVFDEL